LPPCGVEDISVPNLPSPSNSNSNTSNSIPTPNMNSNANTNTNLLNESSTSSTIDSKLTSNENSPPTSNSTSTNSNSSGSKNQESNVNIDANLSFTSNSIPITASNANSTTQNSTNSSETSTQPSDIKNQEQKPTSLQQSIANYIFSFFPNIPQFLSSKTPNKPTVTSTPATFSSLSESGFIENLQNANWGMEIFENVNDLRDDQTLCICVFGRVSTGKSSLLKAFFDMAPDDDLFQVEDLFRVDAQAGTTQRPGGMVLNIPDKNQNNLGKVVILDLPGLHEPGLQPNKAKDEHFLKHLLRTEFRRKLIDVGIFVIDGVVTDTQQKDYQLLSSVSKKVFVVFNKIDSLEYLQKSKRQEILDEAKKQLGVSEIFPTCCKGFDPNANREIPGWYDVRGVDELKKAIYSFVYQYKQKEFLNELKDNEFWGGVKRIGLQTVVGVGVIALAIASRSL